MLMTNDCFSSWPTHIELSPNSTVIYAEHLNTFLTFPSRHICTVSVKSYQLVNIVEHLAATEIFFPQVFVDVEAKT